jgi:hypothetical protein
MLKGDAWRYINLVSPLPTKINPFASQIALLGWIDWILVNNINVAVGFMVRASRRLRGCSTDFQYTSAYLINHSDMDLLATQMAGCFGR